MTDEPDARDDALGRLLRQHLDAGDDDALAARIAARARATPQRPRADELLARWAPVGVAAAAALALAGAALTAAGLRERAATAALADVSRPAGVPRAVHDALTRAGGGGALLLPVLEDR